MATSTLTIATPPNPNELTLDEAHHCASEDELISPQRIGLTATTKAYEAAYQIVFLI